MKTHLLRYLLAALLLTAWCTNAGCGTGGSAPADAGVGAGSYDHPVTGFGGPIAPQGGTITSITPTVGGGLAGGGAAGPVTLGLDSAGCVTNDVKKWNGASWICGSVSSLSGLTTNTILKATSSTTAGNSLLTDDGTTFAINTNKFTVTEANGNTVVGGGLTVGSFSAAQNGNVVAITITHSLSILNGFAANDSMVAHHPSTAQTTGLHTINADYTGTTNTTSSALTDYAGSFSNTATRSAGANNLTNVGIYATASGAQINAALWTDAGDVDLNQTGGQFIIGASKFTVDPATGNTVAAGTATADGGNRVFDLPGTNLTRDGTNANQVDCPNFASGTGGCVPASGGGTTNFLRADGTWAAAGGGTVTGTGTANTMTKWTSTTALGNASETDDGTTFAVGASKLTVTVANGNTSIAGTLGVTGATTLSNNLTAATSTVSAGQLKATGRATLSSLTSDFVATAQTSNLGAAVLTNSGTFDATAAVRTAYGLSSTVTATRSAGANNLTNTAIYGTASGAQVNVALQTDAGDVKINQTGGVFNAHGASTFDSTLNVTGALTEATNRVFSIAGTNLSSSGATINCANFASGTGGCVPASGGGTTNFLRADGTWAAAGGGGITNSAGANVVPKSNGTNLIASAVTDDGTTWSLNGGVITMTEATGASTFGSTMSLNGRLLQTVASSVPVVITDTTNANAVASIQNSNAGAAAAASLSAANNNTTGAVLMTAYGTAFTTAGAFVQDGAAIEAQAGLSGGLNIITDAAASIGFYTGGNASGNLRMTIGSTGTVAVTGAFSVGGAMNMNSQLIDNVLDPASAQDAATKNYVDTHIAAPTAGLISPAALAAASTNDWSPVGLAGAKYIIVTPFSSATTLTGIDSTGFSTGHELCLQNNSATVAITLAQATGSLAANQFHMLQGLAGNMKATALDWACFVLQSGSGWYQVGMNDFGALTVGSFSAAQNGNISGVTFTQSLAIMNGTGANTTLTLHHPATALTTSGFTISGDHVGSYNTTSGALTGMTLNLGASSSRSAGANTLTDQVASFSATGTTGVANLALELNASGGAVSNTALQTDSGDVVLNGTAGNTTIGTTTTNTLTVHSAATYDGSLTVTPSALNSPGLTVSKTYSAAPNGQQLTTITASGTYDTTASIMSNLALSITANATRSAGTNALTNKALVLSASGAQNNDALVVSAGDVLLSSFVQITPPSTITTAAGLVLTMSASSNTSGLGGAQISSGGTYNTTGGVVAVTGVSVTVSGSQATGTNGVVDTAMDLSATSGTTNIALRATNGDVLLNTVSGNLTIGDFNNNSHITIPTGSGTQKPTIASCGTSPTQQGNDSSGWLLTTATPTTSCGVTFHTAYTSNVDCDVWAQTGTAQTALAYSVGTAGISSITAAGGAALASGVKVHWACYDH